MSSLRQPRAEAQEKAQATESFRSGMTHHAIMSSHAHHPLSILSKNKWDTGNRGTPFWHFKGAEAKLHTPNNDFVDVFEQLLATLGNLGKRSNCC